MQYAIDNWQLAKKIIFQTPCRLFAHCLLPIAHFPYNPRR